MRTKNGITLISLIIIIVIMLIISGTATYTGINTIRLTQRTNFNTELKIIHARVDEIALQDLSDEEIGEYGQDISSQEQEVQKKIKTALGDAESTKFRYFEKPDLEEIGVSGIDRQVIINFNTREVVDINGIKVDDTYIYRMEGWSPVEHDENTNTTEPRFELSKKTYGLTSVIEVSLTGKGTIKYGEIVNNVVTSWKTGNTNITIEENGTYRVQVIDAEGNISEQDIEIVNCNRPKTTTGMVPIIYNETTGTWDEVEETSGIWYDYASDNKMWANIKTTAKTANEDGTYNEAQWVWIPRYAYQVPEKPSLESDLDEDVPEFKIVFLKGTTNIPVNEAELGGLSIKTDTSDGVSAGDWVVHPAFTFGDQDFTGIWVAKFEASSNAPNTVADGGDDTSYIVNVKPNVPSWRSISVSNAFDVCRNMTGTAGVLEGLNSVDPHMMKNVEWGAVVYLAQSKHGKNGQVWNNPYWDSDTKTVLTGKAATSAGADAKNTTSCDSYNTGNGPEASTTGNVYGIYDMAGGSHEYVAAYVNNSSAQSDSSITSLRTAVENRDTVKYIDVYKAVDADTPQTNYEENVGKYGDAVYETSYDGDGAKSWQTDYSMFPNTSYVIFYRGAACNVGLNAGIFSYSYSHGNGGHITSFRPVCLLI